MLCLCQVQSTACYRERAGAAQLYLQRPKISLKLGHGEGKKIKAEKNPQPLWLESQKPFYRITSNTTSLKHNIL